MARQDFFTLRVNQAERRMLENLAERLQRTQSDAVRLLIREAAQQLAAEPPTPDNPRLAGTTAVNGGNNATNQ